MSSREALDVKTGTQLVVWDRDPENAEIHRARAHVVRHACRREHAASLRVFGIEPEVLPALNHREHERTLLSWFAQLERSWQQPSWLYCLDAETAESINPFTAATIQMLFELRGSSYWIWSRRFLWNKTLPPPSSVLLRTTTPNSDAARALALLTMATGTKLAVDSVSQSARERRLEQRFARVGREAAYRAREFLRAEARRRLPLSIGPGERPIVFFDSYVSGARAAIPLYSALHARPELPVEFWAGRTSVEKVLRRHGIHALPLFVDAPSLRFWALRRRAQSTRDVLAHVEALPDSVWRLDGIDARPVLLPATRRAVTAHVPSVVDAATWLAPALDASRPCVVVTGTDAGTASRTLELLAANRGIPSVCLQHGLYVDGPFMGTYVSSKSLVWGTGFGDYLRRNGFDADRVSVVGSPFHDEMLRRHPDKTSRNRNESDLCSLLFAASRIGGAVVSEETARAAFELVRQHALKHTECHWSIKLHPADRKRPLNDMIPEVPDNVSVIRDAPVTGLIVRSDVVAIQSSTVGFESALFDKPLVVLGTGRTSFGLPFIDEGVAVFADTVEELERAVSDAQQRDAASQRAAFRKRWFNMPGPNPVKVSVDAVIEVASRVQPRSLRATTTLGNCPACRAAWRPTGGYTIPTIGLDEPLWTNALRARLPRLELQRCGSCASLVAADDRRSAGVLESSYSDVGPQYWSALRSDGREWAETIERHLRPESSGDLWDVGCGSGGILQALSANWRKHGIEPSRDGAERARAPSIDVRRGIASELDLQDVADVVLMVDVVEHLLHPTVELSAVVSMLRPNGRLLVVTGDASALTARIAGRHWYYTQLLGHVTVFSFSGLRHSLERLGLVVEQHHRIEHRGSFGSRRWLARLAGNAARGVLGRPLAPMLYYRDHQLIVCRKQATRSQSGR